MFPIEGSVSSVVSSVLTGLSGGFLYGFNLGISGGLVGPLVQGTFFPDDSIPLDSDKVSNTQSIYEGILTAAVLLGGFFGTFISVSIANRWGRRAGIFTAGAIATICAIVFFFINSYWAIVGVRFVVGITIGFAGTICPLYVQETSPAPLKARLGTLFQIAVCLSIFIAQVCNYVFNPEDSKAAQKSLAEWKWQLQFAFGGFPGILLVIICFFIQESPAYLEQKRGGDSEKNGDGSVNSSTLTEPLALSTTSESWLESGSGSGSSSPIGSNARGWSALFSRVYMKWIFIALLLTMDNALTGINTVIFYAPKIFSDAGLSNILILSFSLVGGWNLCSVFFSYVLVDRFGRRTLMLATLFCMAIATFMLGLAYTAFPEQKGIVAIVAVLLFIGAFENGPGPLYFLMAVESFPDAVSKEALSLVNASNWIINIAIALLFPVITSATSPQFTFFMFSGFGFTAIILTYLFLPENSNKNKPMKLLDEQM